jgi:CRP-like cAMP-binding protein
MAAKIVVSNYNKGSTILKEGAKGSHVFKILSGQVMICRLGPNAKQIPLALLETGEIFGEMYLFSGTNLRNASAIVISSSASLQVYPEKWFLEAFTPLEIGTLNIFENLSARLFKTSSKFMEMLPENEVLNAKSVLSHGEYTGVENLEKSSNSYFKSL